MKRIRRNINKRGFTLTEILLAVMIVGLIGIALAALTRSAARESGSGKTRIMLRNDYARFIRQLHQDLDKATEVILRNQQEGPLLLIRQGYLRDDNETGGTQKTIGYCFTPGNIPAKPSGAFDGGSIFRKVVDGKDTYGNSVFPSGSCSGSAILNNVKYMPNTVDGDVLLFTEYPVPYVQREASNANALRVRLITEVGTDPVVNEAFDQLLTVPSGDFGY